MPAETNSGNSASQSFTVNRSQNGQRLDIFLAQKDSTL